MTVKKSKANSSGIVKMTMNDFSGIKNPEERTEYHREYYRSRKEEISARRRKEYNENPSVRGKLRQKAKDYYDKYKKKGSSVGYSVKEMDGKKLYTIQYLAKACGYTAAYMRTLETKGVIPQALYTDKRGWRFYTKHHLELILTAIGYWRSNQWDWEQVAEYLFSHWEDIIDE